MFMTGHRILILISWKLRLMTVGIYESNRSLNYMNQLGSIANVISFFTLKQPIFFNSNLAVLQKCVAALVQKSRGHQKTWHHLKHTAACITELGRSFLVTLQHVSGNQYHSLLPKWEKCCYSDPKHPWEHRWLIGHVNQIVFTLIPKNKFCNVSYT